MRKGSRHSFLRKALAFLVSMAWIPLIRVAREREAKQIPRPLFHSIVPRAEILSVARTFQHLPFQKLSLRVRMAVSLSSVRVYKLTGVKEERVFRKKLLLKLTTSHATP